MALPWPQNTPTLPRFAPVTAERRAPVESAADTARTARVREVVTSPMTALVVMIVGLAALFVLPMVGLPFVAVVVLPVVIYQLRAEQRQQFRRTRR